MRTAAFCFVPQRAIVLHGVSASLACSFPHTTVPMANFFNPQNGAPLTSVHHAPGAKVMVALYGGGPGGEELDVITDAHDTGPYRIPDPAVREIRRDPDKWTFIYEIDTAKAGGVVRALFRGGDYSAKVKLNADGSLAIPTGKTETRRKIVELARYFVRQNCHYVDGAAGNTPGFANGNVGGNKMAAVKMRASSLDTRINDPRESVLGVNMAKQDLVSYSTCGGRWEVVGDLKPSQAEMDKYFAQVRAERRPDSQWEGLGPSKNLHPRRVHYRGGLKPEIHWGESCHGVPHFDCVGLVNYCYARYYKSSSKPPLPFGLDIKAFLNANSGFVSVAKVKPMNADVIIKTKPHEHIAMVHEVREGSFCIVQAADTHLGLNDHGAYVPSEWQHVLRLPDIFLI